VTLLYPPRPALAKTRRDRTSPWSRHNRPAPLDSRHRHAAEPCPPSGPEHEPGGEPAGHDRRESPSGLGMITTSNHRGPPPLKGRALLPGGGWAESSQCQRQVVRGRWCTAAVAKRRPQAQVDRMHALLARGDLGPAHGLLSPRVGERLELKEPWRRIATRSCTAPFAPPMAGRPKTGTIHRCKQLAVVVR